MTTPMRHSPARRAVLGTLLATAALPWARAQKAPAFVEVWKDEGCGCCADWVKHLEQEGFQLKVHDGGHHPMREKLGLPRQYASCHVGLVGGYLVEGHVPAADIRRLLRDKPKALGLAVPGMPMGAPGMDGPASGGHRDAFDVLLVARDGSATVYQRYPAKS